jgi:hypothetical protein
MSSTDRTSILTRMFALGLQLVAVVFLLAVAGIATRRPWPKTPLVLGECCFCHSTLAVCGDCAASHEEGLVEVRGREVSCECVRSDAWEAA